jgi:predicted Rossmann fold nucleotide-binding protein DprA/Smf involved in DNA uptake
VLAKWAKVWCAAGFSGLAEGIDSEEHQQFVQQLTQKH